MEAELTSASFTFSQEGNCVDGGYEELEIRFESSLGLDHDGGGFFILKTNQWAINNAQELQELFDRINGIIKSKEK
jgi:hypothetical protein